MPLPVTPYDDHHKHSSQVSSQALVRYRTNDYSVPTQYGHQAVLGKGTVDWVDIDLVGKTHTALARSLRTYAILRFFFSCLDDRQSYQDYSIDLCLKATTVTQKKLGMTALNIKTAPVTSATRSPLISNDTINLSCDSATNNEEHQKVASFAPIIFLPPTVSWPKNPPTSRLWMI